MGMGVLDVSYRLSTRAQMQFSYRADTRDEERSFDRALINPFWDMRDSYALSQQFDYSPRVSLRFGAATGRNGFYEGDEDLDEKFNRSVQAFTGEMDYRLRPNLTLRAMGGLTGEQGAVLGLNGTGAMAVGNGKTYYTGAMLLYQPAADWTMSAAYYYGRSLVPRTQSAVRLTDIQSDSFALDARWHRTPQEIIGVQFSSPLRIRRGSAVFNLPVARDLTDDVVYFDQIRVSLKPTAREYDLGLYYAKESENYNWQAEMTARIHPDHMAGIRPDYRALIGWSFKY